MTLSRWLRDYLYIPLGGNRGGGFRTSLNLLITMALGGLWHGASWNFLIWGTLHGLLLVVHRILRGNASEAPLRFTPGTVLAMVATFHAVSALWVFFRAPDLSTATAVFQALATNTWTGEWPVLQTGIVVVCVLAHGIERAIVERSERIIDATRRSWTFAATEGLAFGSLLALSVLCNGTGAAFIYFQF
jgi:alginate O-acetyltransferase complex protein AlgI